ncbi:MAG: copper transporter [Bacillota bacterium]|jgi:hypothetical protein
MIIDLKYHIASLVAVFLALGLGILIGTTMLGNETIVENQKQLTDRMEAQLESLRQNNEAIQARADSLEMENNLQKEFERNVLPVLVAGRLDGKTIAVIETNSYGFSDVVVEAIELAGGRVSSVTTVLNGLQLEDPEPLKQEMGWSENGPGLAALLAGETARAIHTGGNQALLNHLEEAQVLSTGGDYGVAVDAVIVFGGSLDESLMKTGVLDVPVIEYFQSQKIPVFGVEESGVAYSYMKDYQKMRISTVDNVDTVAGQLSLVLSLEGKPGHYGVKSTAQKLMPSPGEGDDSSGGR